MFFGRLQNVLGDERVVFAVGALNVNFCLITHDALIEDDAVRVQIYGRLVQKTVGEEH